MTLIGSPVHLTQDYSTGTQLKTPAVPNINPQLENTIETETETETLIPSSLSVNKSARVSYLTAKISFSKFDKVAFMTPEEFFDTEKDWHHFAYQLDILAEKTATIDCQMPCMYHTANAIKKQLDLQIKSEWLPKSDKDALIRFRQRVEELSHKNYEYRESLEIAIVYAITQDVFAFQSIPFCENEPRQEILSTCVGMIRTRINYFQQLKILASDSSANNFYTENTITLSHFLKRKWGLLLSKFNEKSTSCLSSSEHDNEEEYREISAILFFLFGSTAFNIIEGRNYINLYRYMIANSFGEKILVPSFTGHSVKSINLCQHTALVPIGLTTRNLCLHDEINMSSGLLTFHDIWHELNINSCRISNSPEKQQGHSAVIIFYTLQDRIRCEIHFVGEMMMFDVTHEGGYLPKEIFENPQLGSYVIKDFKKSIDSEWSDVPRPNADYQSDELLKLGQEWLIAVIKRANIKAFTDKEFNIVYTKVARNTSRELHA
ncbi:hypothetical protein D5R81_06595 [Parashewanella spongiae]|uniref:Uncharacterized protein n=1 Tax=Parashewanella spongiae TaxID=342950 RepID=A0A3A6TYK5_9GAMM|nr:hypothetical protein [Parashewanella spongiae]MCL1077775.1 hypothetical protein [Parashewanella spongiae]RJY18172.1 hypothetical protein D5R81_06595 [Parashewanella spongiae]